MVDETSPTRAFVAVQPSKRSRRVRKAVRIIVTDKKSVLLLDDSDPGIGSHWWFTPGGGIDAGESEKATAVRELREETGLLITESELSEPIAHRRVIHGFSDHILDQEETFFLLVTQRFEMDVSGRTADEKITLQGHAWIPIADLGRLVMPLWPANLAQLLAHSPDAGPLELGIVDESTVPVE